MRYHLSPLRHAFELLLNLVGRGPRRSGFTPARDPQSRMRFAQYVCKVQPVPDPAAARQASRLLGQGGALSNGIVRHAPLSGASSSGLSRATLHLISHPGNVATRRRAQAPTSSTSLRTLLDALRVR
jgi:hypothetical protein